MKKFVMILAVAGLIMAAGNWAQAAMHVSYVVTPADLADGPTFLGGQGGVPFGYDHDMPRPEGSTTQYAPGFTSGSFYSNVQGNAAGGGRDYTSFRMSPKDIFGVGDIAINDLSEISYYTKWVSDLDWQLKIYTEGDMTDYDPWYGYRFNFTRPAFGDNAWNLSSTATNLMVSDIYDKWTSTAPSVPGSSELSDLYAGYGTQKILFIDIIASYATVSPPSHSYLDGVKLTLVSGDTATMNLEAIPEPGTMIVWALLGAASWLGMGVWRRGRRVGRQPWSSENRQAIHDLITR